MIPFLCQSQGSKGAEVPRFISDGADVGHTSAYWKIPCSSLEVALGELTPR